MNLHEYQGKSILKKYGVLVPEGILAQTAGEAGKAAEVIQSITGSDKWVVKAQVHAGGRGKGGGVKIARTIEEVMDMGEQSLIELDRTVGDPVDLLLNGKLFAKGEVVTVSENFGVRITEILGQCSQETHHGQ